MTDRRRLNPPPGGTTPPIFEPSVAIIRPSRTRAANEIRKLFLRTGLVPSASGSAYLELAPTDQDPKLLLASSSNFKLTVTVHGPRPLPRNTPFSSTLVLNTHVKFAPFASRTRRGYVRDSVERDLAAHLETALKGVILAERFPKSAVDVIVTVLEGEDDAFWANGQKGTLGGVGIMTVLAGCITASSAALVDAGIDCVDLVTGGVAAVAETDPLIDPTPSEHAELKAACVLGYLQSRDEITELWTKGNVGSDQTALIDKAVEAAQLSRIVLAATLKESVELKLQSTVEGGQQTVNNHG
ncbi:exoribonuclease [Myriangium duriaei CBS 260.36]|uniref:Exoribonuclease n=1 Tax=Myriangium duriaei CBS 260.36 TaxID=1168546 RepID=A0A9P4IRW8_9PEZI|nr:exoribonuclease [Myriangium duriaei CBS 260.36]